MLEFIEETLLLLPFLFLTYLVLEAVEAKAGGALEAILERARSVGPLAGALAGAIPQCGVSAAASSLYAGGVITAGTLMAVMLSTADELLPVLISERVPAALLVKIVTIKVLAAIAMGFTVNAVLNLFKHKRRKVEVHELCEHSHCACAKRKGIVVPALIHTAEVFGFIVAISGLIELAMHFWGEGALAGLKLSTPYLGEMLAGLLGLIPNCAVSVAAAKLYMTGAMSAGALMASSFTGSGLGVLVLFRTNRNLKENLQIILSLYAIGTILGLLTGPLL